MKRTLFGNTATDIIEAILKKCKQLYAPRKCFRVVHYKKTSPKSLGFEGVSRTFHVKLYGGHTFTLAVFDSEGEREEFLRHCKEQGTFVPALVDNGKSKEEILIEHFWMLIRNFIRYFKRQARKHRHVRPGRKSTNYVRSQTLSPAH